MNLVVGVDGGNTKAIALVAQSDGSIIGAARRPGSADIYSGAEAALELLDGVVDDALADAGASRSEVRFAVFSVAGADWPEDIAFLRTSLTAAGVGRSVSVVNDAIGALIGAVPDGPAVVVSLGTGAATGARGTDGTMWHSSFWQLPQGALELARRTLDGLIRSELDVEPAPMLQERVLTAVGEASVAAVVHRMTRRGRGSSGDVGGIVRALYEAADAGDPVADRIIVEHGTGIGEIAAAAARRVHIDQEPYAIAFCGGAVRSGGSRLVSAAVDAVSASGQQPRVVSPRWEPAVGALLIGLRAQDPAGDRPPPDDRLEATLQAMAPSDLFD